VDQKTRTLEHGKRAPPLSSKPQRDWATFRKQRRDLSSVSFIGISFRVVLGFFMVLLLVVVCFSRRILGRFPALQKCVGSASLFGSSLSISLSSSGVI
jgi:hypothetical protein